MTDWIRAYLGLGSNLGQRIDHLQQAVVDLENHPLVEIQALSGVFESEFVGEGQQDPYLNACVAIATQLEPHELLTVLKELEQAHGRQPASHALPRPLDIDILLYDNEVCRTGRLELPHPRSRERAFVLEPLAQIAGVEIFPDSGETVAAACAKIRQKSGPWLRACPELSLKSELDD